MKVNIDIKELIATVLFFSGLLAFMAFLIVGFEG